VDPLVLLALRRALIASVGNSELVGHVGVGGGPAHTILFLMEVRMRVPLVD